MANFLSRRILYGLLVLLGVVVVVFFLFNVLPADPARMVVGQRSDVASIEAINKDLGRDKSLSVQFLMYLNDLSPISVHSKDQESSFFMNPAKYGSAIKVLPLSAKKALYLKAPYLRRSYQNNRKVTEMLLDALPGTFVLAITAMLIATILGIALGAIAAIKKGTIYDSSLLGISFIGTSAPSFFAAIIIAWLFGYVLQNYTGLNLTGSLYEIDPFRGEILSLKNLVLPAVALGIRPLAIVTQLTRSAMLEELSKDYVRTARAKGLTERQVVVKHALRNALNPVITAISGWFASLMAGAFFVEYIFGWKGIGKLTVDALEKYDFPVVMGSVLIVAGIFVIVNILVDVIYGILDPRIRLE